MRRRGYAIESGFRENPDTVINNPSNQKCLASGNGFDTSNDEFEASYSIFETCFSGYQALIAAFEGAKAAFLATHAANKAADDA
uniref:Uncharacterized protein n=1 Tax=Candidatus Kentrum sp. UNK TaxID=2126344 RepID=A0A451AZK7_9GAMM|nr:MAG: hypothetical protein BECKUNK1418G_GA0071005_10611 [Candidatus Kentron sp. UNK]VFK71489.1 MAG: hypothetical protein BECKUNK1418H_GA0071006_10692 [Candidatus Kentron sp. UNK]